MAEGNYDSIKPLDTTSQKEALPLLGLVALDMIAVIVAVYIAGAIMNAI